MTLPLIIALAVLAALSFFFSLSETSIIGLSKLRLRHMLSKGVKHAKSVERLVSQSEKLIISILVGNNFVNICFSVIVTVIVVSLVPGSFGPLLATAFTTVFILVFCEILPKILALKNAERMALFVAPVMEGFVRVLSPLTRVFIRISQLLLTLLGIEQPKRSPLVTEEELRLMIEVGKDEGVLTDEERRMLHRIFEFGDIRVRDAMISRAQIVAVNISSSLEQVLDIFAEEGHSRLPVYKDDLDHIVGIVYARDLIYMMRDSGLFVLADIIHKPYFVPGTMRVNELLRKFQGEKVQLAIVTDDKQNTLGVVTLEDLIEEIVGEIEEAKPK
jgi:CBS domain containing-hemolysin-like protein